MIEDLPGWVRIAGVLAAVLLIPTDVLIARLVHRRQAQRPPRGWRRG